MDKKPSITTFFNVNFTVLTRVLEKNTNRTGFVLCNRSATTIYIGNNQSVSVGSSSTVRLLQNEILTVLESEGDDPTRDVWAIPSAVSNLDIVESVRI